MSFTSELKTKLVKKSERKKCCRNALITAVILVDGSIHIKDKRIALDAVTENASVAKRIKQSLESYGLSSCLVIRRSNLLSHSNYLVEARGDNLIKVLSDLGITNEKGVPNLEIHIEELDECCQKAFLKGLFLSGGYINSPDKGYRLQLIMNNYNLAKKIKSILNIKGFKATLIEKKDMYINISNRRGVLKFLVWIGATDVLLQFENVQIIKDMKNYANRLVNSDTANMKRTAITSMSQIKMIDYIKIKKGFDFLPNSLSEISYLRLSYPTLSFEDLGKKNDPYLSKSAVNHRFRRLKTEAEKLGFFL